MKRQKVYLDTSIINFLFAEDAPDFKKVTVDFFENYVRQKVYEVFVSDVVVKEILKTQDLTKREKLLSVIRDYNLEMLQLDKEGERLANVYIAGKVIPENKIEDAQHIGISTVQQMDVLLSWNFKHLANINKKLKIKFINEREGYFYPLDLLTPLELMYENEN
ncbi:MAG: type II toxin-antitoxin system VapC family toxin [Ignavibacteriales bacterium]|nr:type II toxin-antitoxin system VapC family toxin [Ignavibacteriales bacterium]